MPRRQPNAVQLRIGAVKERHVRSGMTTLGTTAAGGARYRRRRPGAGAQSDEYAMNGTHGRVERANGPR